MPRDAPTARHQPPAAEKFRILPDFTSAPCKGVDLQWVRIPPGKGLLQPVAVGAVVEATKRLKPLMSRVASGDLASMQAVT